MDKKIARVKKLEKDLNKWRKEEAGIQLPNIHEILTQFAAPGFVDGPAGFEYTGYIGANTLRLEHGYNDWWVLYYLDPDVGYIPKINWDEEDLDAYWDIIHDSPFPEHITYQEYFPKAHENMCVMVDARHIVRPDDYRKAKEICLEYHWNEKRERELLKLVVEAERELKRLKSEIVRSYCIDMWTWVSGERIYLEWLEFLTDEVKSRKERKRLESILTYEKLEEEALNQGVN